MTKRQTTVMQWLCVVVRIGRIGRFEGTQESSQCRLEAKGVWDMERRGTGWDKNGHARTCGRWQGGIDGEG